jgi:5-methylcytosine-specific restriction endonuclease McrA
MLAGLDTNGDPLKHCKRCDEWKPQSAFSKGGAHRCKPCQSAYFREWYTSKYPEKVRATRERERVKTQKENQLTVWRVIKKYLKRCPDCERWLGRDEFHKDSARPGSVHGSCKACNNARASRWYHANGDRMREYRKRTSDVRRPYIRKWYEENRDRYNQTSRKWRQNNPGKAKAIFHRARLRRMARSEGSYTSQEWQALVDYYGNVCLKCGVAAEDALYSNLTVDHVIPLSKGGSNQIENLQPLCWNCNVKKGVRAIDYRPRPLPDFVRARLKPFSQLD